jgi:hypothetical protein
MKMKSIWPFTIPVLVLFIGLPVTPGLSVENDLEIILGTVIPQGPIITERGEKYAIDPDETGKEVLRNEGKKIIITGHVCKRNGQKMITASSYQLVEEGNGGESAGSDE